ncbi:MAG: hypothetical protein F6K19_36090 [Cyanothece sp. SIO1E1]|nr:hypothetical protein [Cyanothece sp. SIO1E1]
MLYVLTRFILPLGFASVGIAWSLSGEWNKFINEERSVFSHYSIVNYCFRGSFLFGSCGAAVGISVEKGLDRKAKQDKASARARLINQVNALTGSATLGDETRAAITLVLEELKHEV